MARQCDKENLPAWPISMWTGALALLSGAYPMQFRWKMGQVRE
jgi:hypothetical protein